MTLSAHNFSIRKESRWNECLSPTAVWDAARGSSVSSPSRILKCAWLGVRNGWEKIASTLGRHQRNSLPYMNPHCSTHVTLPHWSCFHIPVPTQKGSKWDHLQIYSEIRQNFRPSLGDWEKAHIWAFSTALEKANGKLSSLIIPSRADRRFSSPETSQERLRKSLPLHMWREQHKTKK